jgi:two-component system, chemotaxis family, protein-glutamate methylesterase/glutaminase
MKEGLKKIDVLIIDDSAVVREMLSEKLSENGRINIVGTAADPYIAREKIAKHHIDVITLDIEMPRMDGLTFLKYLMKYYPIPVIILSSLTDRKNKASMEALELGAVDIVPKPGGSYSVGDVIGVLMEKIEMASEIDFEKVKAQSQKNLIDDGRKKIKYLSTITTTNKLIAVGASTGGTVALEKLFKTFDKTFPPALTVIHMPEKFTYTYANRLNDLCEVTVKEAEDNEIAMTGHVYIAPGNYHLIVKLVGKDRVLKVVKGPAIFNQRPAVDVLFNSVAENIGQNSIGVLLTGMGRDGAEGLLNIKNGGGFTIAQDEKTSIVFGMPKVAIELGAADLVLPIDKITENIASKLGS